VFRKYYFSLTNYLTYSESDTFHTVFKKILLQFDKLSYVLRV
jgi:hypothetical protein